MLSRVSQQNPVFIPTTPPCPVWSFNISFNELGLFIQAFLGIFAPLPIWHSIIHRQSELVEHGPPRVPHQVRWISRPQIETRFDRTVRGNVGYATGPYVACAHVLATTDSAVCMCNLYFDIYELTEHVVSQIGIRLSSSRNAGF